MNNYEDLINTLLKEAIEKERLEEKNTNQEFKLDTDAVVGNVDQIQQDSSVSGQNLILNIQDIARSLITGTESDQRDSMSIATAFEKLRETNVHVESLKNVDENGLIPTLISALSHYFLAPTNPPRCTDLSSMFTRYTVLSAYSLIFKEYSGSPAGFVNESFLAGLLGGTSIPATSGKTIADIGLQGGTIGISLKTVKSDDKLSGSFTNLMRTLGIKFRVEGASRDYLSTFDSPKHSKGLYYLLFNKDSDTSHTISCFKVDREEVLQAFETYYTGQRGAVMSKDNDGTYVFRSKKDFDNIKSKFAGLLGVKFDTNLSDNIVGISNLTKVSQDIAVQQPIVDDDQSENIQQIVKTLNLLNNFYSSYVNSVVSFISDPMGANLKNIKDQFVEMSKIDPVNLINPNKCD